MSYGRFFGGERETMYGTEKRILPRISRISRIRLDIREIREIRGKMFWREAWLAFTNQQRLEFEHPGEAVQKSWFAC